MTTNATKSHIQCGTVILLEDYIQKFCHWHITVVSNWKMLHKYIYHATRVTTNAHKYSHKYNLNCCRCIKFSSITCRLAGPSPCKLMPWFVIQIHLIQFVQQFPSKKLELWFAVFTEKVMFLWQKKLYKLHNILFTQYYVISWDTIVHNLLEVAV